MDSRKQSKKIAEKNLLHTMRKKNFNYKVYCMQAFIPQATSGTPAASSHMNGI